MPSYEVKVPFRDKDTEELFGVGSEYFTEDPDRVKFLQNEGYLGEVINEQTPDDDADSIDQYHTGGGYYELPNGDKVRGKDKAIAALKELIKEKGDE